LNKMLRVLSAISTPLDTPMAYTVCCVHWAGLTNPALWLSLSALLHNTTLRTEPRERCGAWNITRAT
jgi:hypothetical protein